MAVQGVPNASELTDPQVLEMERNEEGPTVDEMGEKKRQEYKDMIHMRKGHWKFAYVCMSALLLNVMNTMFTTIPQVERVTLAGTWMYPKTVYTCRSIELICTCIFIFEYYVRFFSASGNKLMSIFRPFRIVDGLCLIPGIMQLIFNCTTPEFQQGNGSWLDDIIDCLLTLRVVRVLDFAPIRGQSQMIMRALSQAMENIAIPAILALDIWVLSAAMFMFTESFYNSDEKDHMFTMPDSLFWTSIFLIGEWANVDFSPGAGSRLCIFYCLFGVAMFAIPVGLIVEAVQSTMEDIAQETKDLRQLRSSPSFIEPATAEGKTRASSKRESWQSCEQTTTWRGATPDVAKVQFEEASEKHAHEEQERKRASVISADDAAVPATSSDAPGEETTQEAPSV